jgi:hypothetical protein
VHTHFKEREPSYFDLPWWREYWKRNAIQGAIVNAGGIAAYYPSKFPLHRRAEFLNGQDIAGEWIQAAHEDGLAVLARVNSGQISEEAFRAHPEWVTRLSSGEPYRRGDGYASCINSSYYEEYVPGILQEIIERTHPEGIYEAEWGLQERRQICYCENCARKFRDKTGEALPKTVNWDDPTYRKWIQWNYERHTRLWDFNNQITRAAGGAHCLWVGLVLPYMNYQNGLFQDLRELGKRSEFYAFLGPGPEDEGKRVHQLVGWDKLAFALTVIPLQDGYAGRDAQSRLDTVEAIAGGLGPQGLWQGAYQYDRRVNRTSERMLQWHAHHQRYLINRRPVAAVGMIWSQRNNDYYGRDNAEEVVEAPYRGFRQALIRARIPYLPIHASDIEEQASGMAVLILPNVGALSDAECESIREFVRRGGALIATGATSLYNEWGDARPDFALADLFGAHAPSGDFGRTPPPEAFSFLRLRPELRGKAWGPKGPDDPDLGERHPILRGFDETDVIAYGGEVPKLRTDAGTIVPLTFVSYPNCYTKDGSHEERIFIHEAQPDIAALVLRSTDHARVAYLPADVDRRYAHIPTLDHGQLLANIVRWAAGDRVGFEMEGPGYIDCHVYRQERRMIVHLVNLTNRAQVPLSELLTAGPLRLKMRLPEDIRGSGIECLVSGDKPAMTLHQGWITVGLPSVLDHEVLVIS